MTGYPSVNGNNATVRLTVEVNWGHLRKVPAVPGTQLEPNKGCFLLLNHTALNGMVLAKDVHSVDMLGAVGGTKAVSGPQAHSPLPALCWVDNTNLSMIARSLFPTFSHCLDFLFIYFLHSYSLSFPSRSPSSLCLCFHVLRFMFLDCLLHSLSLCHIPFPL